jgi:PAS domain-containing protein
MIENAEKFNVLFNNMSEGVTLHRYVRNDKNEIINYIIEDVNPAFENILKMKKEEIVGKLATDVYKVNEAPYLKEYSNLKSDQQLQFEVFFAPLEKYFYISVSPWGDDGFATIFFDITARKKVESELKEKNENLEKMNRLMVDREVKMVELKNELKDLDNKK